jgi:hypothetical protein
MHTFNEGEAVDCPPEIVGFLLEQVAQAGIGGRWQLIMRGELDGLPVVLLAVAALLPTDANGAPDPAALSDAMAGGPRPSRPH